MEMVEERVKKVKYKLEMKYKIKGNEALFFTSDWAEGEQVVAIAEDLANSNKVTDITFYDERGTSWTLREMKKLLEEVEEEPHDVTVYFDGGYDKAMRKAGLGAVVYYKQGKKKFRIRCNEVFDELKDNNEAEYAALYFAVNLLEEMEVHHMSCEFKGDSQVVLNQLSGEWPCYEENLNAWLDRIEEKLKKMGINGKYTPIPRNDNKEAHKLASQALEHKMINSKMQVL